MEHSCGAMQVKLANVITGSKYFTHFIQRSRAGAERCCANDNPSVAITILSAERAAVSSQCAPVNHAACCKASVTGKLLKRPKRARSINKTHTPFCQHQQHTRWHSQRLTYTGINITGRFGGGWRGVGGRGEAAVGIGGGGGG